MSESDVAAVPVAQSIFTTAEASDLSGLSRLGVIWNITHGHLRARKVGTMWLISREDLADWLSRREDDKRRAEIAHGARARE